MTPELDAVYAELLERASRPPHHDQSRRLRELFLERCGRFEPDHPAAAAREQAAWEDALVRGGLLSALASELEDPAERSIAVALLHSQRGVFVFERVDDQLLALDLWSRAQFVVVARDGIGRDVASAGVHYDSPPCQARVVASAEGVMVLPGAIFHPADARPAIERALADARKLKLATDQALDALLRMEHAWQTMSRVKVAYAYRADSMR
jgi:hypothetical protein